MSDLTDSPAFRIIENDMRKVVDTINGAFNLYLYAYGNGDTEEMERLKTIYPFLRGDNE